MLIPTRNLTKDIKNFLSPQDESCEEKTTAKDKRTSFTFLRTSLPENQRTNNFIPKKEPYYFYYIADDIADDIREKKPVLLTGHSGYGKSSLIVQMAACTKNGLFRVNLNGQATISDFVGSWIVKNGETIWVDGFLPKAMKDGYWLLCDEIDFAEPAILSCLNGILEPNGKLILKEKGFEIVEPHEDFRIFGTGNSIGKMSEHRVMYQGTCCMNAAFIDRWRVYEIKDPPKDVELQIIKLHCPKFTDNLLERSYMVATRIREAFKKEEISETLSTRRLIEWCTLMMRYRDPVKAAETTIFNKMPFEDSEVIRKTINKIMLGKDQ